MAGFDDNKNSSDRRMIEPTSLTLLLVGKIISCVKEPLIMTKLGFARYYKVTIKTLVYYSDGVEKSGLQLLLMAYLQARDSWSVDKQAAIRII